MTVERPSEWVSIGHARGFDSAEYASSIHGAQARILQTINEPLTYDDLICYSGFAFRIQTHKAMCPSARHPAPGFPCVDNSNRALPWETRSFAGSPWTIVDDRARFEADARAAVKDSIDRGVPVHYGSVEDGLIIGYGEDGNRWWCVHPFHSSPNDPFWYDEAAGLAGGGEWPWTITVWTGPKPENERASRRDLTTAGLRQAVEMWDAGERGGYQVGDAAYESWLAWLRDVEAGAIEDPRPGMHGNGWYFEVLAHCRRIAGRWLARIADEVPGSRLVQDLRQAADHYSRIAEESMEAIDCAEDLAPRAERLDTWTSAMRQEQIKRLESAREHDCKAIVLLSRAVDSL